MIEIKDVMRAVQECLPGWDDYAGCESEWMKYRSYGNAGICSHDDDSFCQHRQEHLLALIELKLKEQSKR